MRLSEPLQSAFAFQSGHSERLGSPFMARLMQVLPDLIADHGALARRLRDWPGDPGPMGAVLPLRVSGGLHHLVLSGADPGLTTCWPPSPGTGLEPALAAALERHDVLLAEWITHAPQTNEVGRSAVLLAGAAEVQRWSGLPLMLSELGSSGGLNLNFPLYALDVNGVFTGSTNPALTLCPEWSGAAPLPGPLTIAGARGVDLNPLDPAQDGLRLLAYIWPDQQARLARMRAALAAARVHPPVVDCADAADWLEDRLGEPWPGRCHLVLHTIAFQYFPAASKARVIAAMERAGAAATSEAPLAWMAMEADGDPDSAAVTLRLWPGDRRHTLGRAGFHGQFIRWSGTAG